MVKRVIYPPMWLLIGIIATFFLNEYYPGPRFTSLEGQLAGGVLIVIGLALLVVAGGLFQQAGTNLIPFREVTALVTTGVYRYSRNPMYLGMASVLLGLAVTVGATTALLVPPVFMAIIEFRYIRPEEDMLRGVFPEEFLAYCQRVRRWI
jgi:protein-S-isoprenylcysteine O-methyltransferase Ste14